MSPFVLTRNCRNTSLIDDVPYRYCRGVPTEAHLDGADVTILDAHSVDRRAQRIVSRVIDLLVKEQVPAKFIVVLIADLLHRSDYQQALDHRADRLPKPRRGGTVDQPDEDGIAVEGNPKLLVVPRSELLLTADEFSATAHALHGSFQCSSSASHKPIPHATAHCSPHLSSGAWNGQQPIRDRALASRLER